MVLIIYNKTREGKRYEKIKNVNENDHIVIDFVAEDKVCTYYLKEAKSGQRRFLISFRKESPSIRSYFGVSGKTIREIYDFDCFENKKLVKEINWLWRKLEGKECQKARKEKHKHENKYERNQKCCEIYGAETTA